MSSRPTFFLSSTIYDFRDLRGAIKFTLEAHGCRVFASEFNDFGNNLEQHSYDACLSNIDNADYFILLVGARVGGWYDEPNRISITQQEYRTAYERHKKGLIRIVALVRSEVWQLREDRKALAHHLEEMDLAEAELKAIKNFPSKFATDAEFIGSFLSEIGRNVETARAVRKSVPKPTGNWIHVFHDFRDVHDVLHPLVFSGLTSDEAAYRKALQHELLMVLSRLLLKVEGEPRDMRRVLEDHLRECPIDRGARELNDFDIDNDKWQSFSTILFQALGLHFEVVVINDALTSSLFLSYDGATATYVQNPAFEALWKLVEEIRMFNAAATTENLSLIFEFSPKNIGKPCGKIRIPTQRLAMLYGLAHRWINIVSLCTALIRHLEGETFHMPKLMPFSPIQGLDEQIAAEQVSAAEARAALGI